MLSSLLVLTILNTVLLMITLYIIIKFGAAASVMILEDIEKLTKEK